MRRGATTFHCGGGGRGTVLLRDRVRASRVRNLHVGAKQLLGGSLMTDSDGTRTLIGRWGGEVLMVGGGGGAVLPPMVPAAS